MISFMKRLAKEYAIFLGLLVFTVATNHLLAFQFKVWSWVSFVFGFIMIICLLRFAPFPFSIITLPVFNILKNSDEIEDEAEKSFEETFADHMEYTRRNLYEKNATELGDMKPDKYLDPNFDGFE